MTMSGSRSGLASAFVFAVGGVGYALWRPTPANFLIMASMLLLAWNMAFTPGPPLRSTVRGIYRQARAGSYRTPATSKLVTIAALTLFIAGICLNVMQ
jgi:hypothetical protein